MPGNANQHSRFRVKPLCAALLFGFAAQATTAQHAQANPTGASVINGQAGFAASGNTLTVTNTPGAILHWQDFSIGANEITRFAQQSASSAVLNRVTGPAPSDLLGSLQSNGRVFLVNPHGIVFGQDAVIDTAGFIASTLDISDRDFLEGRLRFAGGGNGALKNRGTIRADGDIYLVGPQIENTGLIRSESGSVLLAAGQSVTITGPDAQGVQFALQAPEDSALNLGTIEAKNAAAMFAGTLRHSGDIRATRVTLSAKGEAMLEIGSTVTANGDGANVLVWSDDTARAHGTISAKDASGKGGFVETSARTLDVNGIRVDTGGGEWLIDPNDFTIAASGGNMSGADVTAALASGNFTIISSDGIAGNGDIHVNDAVSWSANLLTLTAARDINLNAVMTASGTSSLTMNTATANGADAAVGGGIVKAGLTGSGFTGRVDFPGRSGVGFFTINGTGYTVINTDAALQGMALGGFYALGSNIDASATLGWNTGAGFAPIGTSGTPFAGKFDGLGHTVSNLTINRPTTDAVGLWAHTDNASIRNVGFTGLAIIGRDVVGGLVGQLFNSTIGNAYTTGNVTGRSVIGGLVGYQGTPAILRSWSSANITGVGPNPNVRYIGGLVGILDGSITDSYATGNVESAANGFDIGGLVGYVSPTGTISNSYATGSINSAANAIDNVGGLAGINYGTIDTSYSTGAVWGASYVGGLVGFQTATLSNSYSTGNVIATGNEVGGLVGRNDLGDTITNSYSTGTVSGNDSVGGLAGKNDGIIDTAYHYSGSVSGDWNVGGLVGYNTGTIANTHNTGSVIGAPNTDNSGYGGLVGRNSAAGTIDNAYSTGNVSGDWDVGGLVGINDGSITNSYSTGDAAGSSFYGGEVGGLVGWNKGTISNSHAGGNVSGYDNYIGGLVGWNNYGSISTAYSTGSVASTSGYVGGLVGWNNFGTISIAHNTGSVTSTGSYVGGLVGWNNYGSISMAYSTGSVTSTGLYVGGLAGWNNFGTISVAYSTGSVNSTGSYVGGLAGWNDGGATVDTAYSTGSVSGLEYVGGAVGWNDGTISITYNTGAIAGSGVGNQNIGGLVGYNLGAITDTYNTGSVSGGQRIGGLVGANDGTGSITNSYSAGSVTGSSFTGGLAGRFWAGTVTDSYWDTDTSAQSASPGGGTGLTTAPMQQQASFSGWNFAATWNIDEAVSYPYFQANEQIPHPGCVAPCGGGSGSGGTGSAYPDVYAPMLATQTLVLNDRFIAAATTNMSAPQDEENRKDGVLTCR